MERIKLEVSDDKNVTILEKIASGKVLIEEQNHIDGDFLIFGTKEEATALIEKRKPLSSVDERLDDFESRISALENAKVPMSGEIISNNG